MNFRVKRLTSADAQRCAELEQQLFAGDNPWPRDVFVVEFAQPYTFYWGVTAGEEEELVGYAGLARLGPPDDPEFEIHTVGVDPAYQRQGIGRMLMEQMMHAVDLADGQVFLEVRTDNEPAIAMYRAYGFEILATRRNYYQPSGADAYTMVRKSRSER